MSGMALIVPAMSDIRVLPPSLGRLLPLTGLTRRQFTNLVILLSATQRRHAGRPHGLPLAARLLMFCVGLRTNLTTRQLAALFDISQSSVDRINHVFTPILAGLLAPDPASPPGMAIIDGTLIPDHDHTKSAVSKKQRRSACTQVLVHRSNRRVLAVEECWPGNRNDIVVARATMTEHLAAVRGPILGDSAYHSPPGIVTPRTDSSGRIIRDHHWERHKRMRATVEHVIARLKDWAILRQCRRKGQSLDQLPQIIARLHNLRQQSRVNS